MHPGTKTTTQVKEKPTVEFVHEGAEPVPAKPVSVPVPRHISHGGADNRSEPASNPRGGGWGRSGEQGGYRWAKGGLIRKNYSPGGIVGLL